MLKRIGSKVEQNRQAKASGGQVVDRLGCVPGVQRRDRFNLQDDFVLYHKIGYVLTHRDPFVGHREAHKLLEVDAA